MYVDSSICVRVKGGESEQFCLDSRVRQGCITSPWLFYVYMDGMVKMGLEKRGLSFVEDGSEWRLLGLLYADDLALCSDSEGEWWDGLLRYVEGED